MKAQHRHELRTNALADGMGRLIQGIRERPKSSAAALWIIAGLALATALVWYFAGAGSSSAEWIQLDGVSDIAQLDRIARESPGSAAARAARFQKARLELEQGLRGLYTPERGRAILALNDARRLFLELAPESVDQPLMVQEAVAGAARAEEALIGVPLPDKPGETVGTLDQAIKLYQKVAELDANSYLGKRSAEHAADLDKSRADVEKFYADLNKFADARKAAAGAAGTVK